MPTTPSTARNSLGKKSKKKEPIESTDKPKRKRSTKAEMYFTTETEDAIVAFNTCEEKKKREEIYNSKIKYAFEKIVENIYNKYKFMYSEVPADSTMKEALSHLVQNISKYSKEKGKAFGYFSTIAKNWLIINNNNTYAKFKRNVEICEQPTDAGEFIVEPNHSAGNIKLKEFISQMVLYWEKNIPKKFTSPEERSIAYHIIELFKRSDSIELINKKALYLCIREMSNCGTNDITKVINKMKPEQLRLRNDFFSDGIIDTD